MSSLNDAKSAYGKFHFDSGFFERCTSPPLGASGGRRSANAAAAGRGARSAGGGDNDTDDEEFYDTRYVCRVPVRSVHSILRPRKGVCSLRIRSEGMDDRGNYFGLNKKKKRRDQNKKKGGRSSSHSSRGRNNDNNRGDEDDDDDDESDNDEDGDDRRGSYSARERSKSRKRRRKQSRIRRNNNANPEDEENDPNSISTNTDKMMLSFEYFIERPTPKTDANNNPNNVANGGVFRVLHKVGVTDANGITLSASVTSRRTRSEIVSPPKLWLRLLDPLRRTAEVALTIDDTIKVVTATTFHPGEIAQLGNGEEQNAVLAAAAARNAVLKTETSTGIEEFDEYDFRNNRGKKRKNKKKKSRRRKNGSDGSEEDSVGGEQSEEDDEEEDFEKESEKPPLDVNEKVILVFSIKEAKVCIWRICFYACVGMHVLILCSLSSSCKHTCTQKAMLQYCAQTSTSYDDDGCILSFHWGGKPIVIETDGDYFTGELVLATLHHGMIASNIIGGGNDGGHGSGRRVSAGGE